ncbi:uncharacterized protein LOC134537485 [Bacillus rossius redtenbacheri]|uniref:uncharacterized protein LOC134537485 n=1 Tax=Bacillus rossius redtenbacheri TaxID=93214 RepID=UPI002FDDC478
MKAAPSLLLVLAIARLARGATEAAETTEATEAAPVDECARPCREADTGPVCAGDVVTPPVTFGSSCRLREYNCRRHRSLEVIQKGPCDDEEEEQFIFPNKIVNSLSAKDKKT